LDAPAPILAPSANYGYGRRQAGSGTNPKVKMERHPNQNACAVVLVRSVLAFSLLKICVFPEKIAKLI